MRPVPSAGSIHQAVRWRTRLQLILNLNRSRVALAFAVLLAFVSLFLPLWSLGQTVGNDRAISSFSWTYVTTDGYRSGAWTGSQTLPYSSSQFSFRSVAGVLSNAYIVDLVFLVVLAVVLALYSIEYSRTMPTVSLLILSVIVVGAALFALFYPIIGIPAAATTDMGTFTIRGFWGAMSDPPADWSWGPGTGWWLVLFSVVLGVLGTILPYIKSIQAMPHAPKAARPPA